ncbi:hypothetical protein Pmani_014559 [Petrolisthes manimaculis]|uniref:Uncharacterized protein n=1 Tax=Petrolisthes manimaculis TaxID=1843537 RepID=A0AAE1PV97_9EUCA|nr:hypothetical protein Pmani_014559 [Petrolisthes manimaculis]
MEQITEWEECGCKEERDNRQAPPHTHQVSRQTSNFDYVGGGCQTGDSGVSPTRTQKLKGGGGSSTRRQHAATGDPLPYTPSLYPITKFKSPTSHTRTLRQMRA